MEIDLRPGGRMSFVMVDDATGRRYPNSGTVLEVEAPARIVWAKLAGHLAARTA